MFQQSLLGCINGINDLGVGQGCDISNTAGTIFAEVKNKHNTMNSASAGKTYIKMQNQLLKDDDCACFLVEAIAQTLPGCRVSASCDLTKLYEKTIRGTADEVLSMLRANAKAEKGEYCLVLDMADVALEVEEEVSSASLEAQLFEELLCGGDLRQAAELLMERGAKRNDVYKAKTNVQRFLDDMIEQAFAAEEEDDE